MEKYENAGSEERITANHTQPRAVHLAYGENPSQSMVVLWAAEVYTRCRVVYGTQQDNLDYKVKPSSKKIVQQNDFGMQYWYRAEFRGLKAGTRYYYRIIAGVGAMSNIFYFSTIPKRSATFQPSFLVFGDFGLETVSFNTVMSEGMDHHYDAVLHLGDIAYNLFSLKGVTGDNFLNGIERTAAHVPYLTAPGDHENPHHFHHYRYRFSMPGVPWPMPEEKLWYSLDIGNVHLISFNTETYFHSIPNIGRQFLWLVDDLHLASKNRHKTPWIVVMGHKPLYCSQTFPQDCNKPDGKLRQGLEELFYTFGVDLVLFGHCHSYERSWPMYKGEVLARDYNNPKGPVYITSGTTGNQYVTDTISNKKKWSAFLMSETQKEGFGRLEMLNDTHLSWKYFLTSNHKVIDSIVIEKLHHGPNADIENFIRRARANQTMEQLLLGQNLSVAMGDFSGWRAGSVMMVAFALVVLLFLFRVTVVDLMETEVHRGSYLYRKFTAWVQKTNAEYSPLHQV